MKIAVNMLEHSPRVKVRSGLDKATIARYVEAYQAGVEFDPVIVFCEAGTERFVVADGSHRTEAAKQAGVAEIEATIKSGDETDALKFALRCNADHGLLRRDGDVLACIRSLMLDPVLTTQYRTHTERSELLGMSYKTFQRHFSKWRQSKGGTREERALKEEMQEIAEKKTPHSTRGKQTEKAPDVDTVSTSEPPTNDADPDLDFAPPTKPKPPRKSDPKPELTAEQKKVAKEMAEAAKRDRLDASNRKTFVEGLEAIRSIPHDGAYAAKKWGDIDVEQVRYVREWCDEFLREREKIGKAA